MPCFHYLLHFLLPGSVSHSAFSSFAPLEFLLLFFYAQPELLTFHVTASLSRLEIMITVQDLSFETLKSIVNLNRCCDLFFRNNKWVAREGQRENADSLFLSSVSTRV